MSILIDETTRIVVQGITGRDGRFHALKMKHSGSRVVAGVTPGKEGQNVEGIPVFHSVHNAVKHSKADTALILVPPRFAADAICEASDAGVKLVVAITEGIPTLDVMKALKFLERNKTLLIGPNCPGLISPGKCKVGILPDSIFTKGRIGLISRSGTLTYEVVNHLTQAGIGQSTCIGIGGDPVVGMGFIDLLERFEADPETEGVVLIGEIGGNAEEKAAEFIAEKMTKPVAAFVAGRSAPPGKRMGHAGAIISSGSGTAAEKIAAFETAGVAVAKEPAEFPELIHACFKSHKLNT
ncbi:succinate--CoA ligase subunit alpha [candidate division KSB3 bacterium]|uniref:Succinate--CoA ligase [ADP-forming] subunit alpha n=1 Tax=candidate division KSB3 bacterium TaxID=2044937 RepID=A0A2G6EAQ0_9BACT|nr:MAG: succinate--CoA ligase subunit alpha [candidate division KSB3 bacterium]PIE30693.1 MAG: succinate--CoA ligase subunit alpha [candidate division KSB3 bacterium]